MSHYNNPVPYVKDNVTSPITATDTTTSSISSTSSSIGLTPPAVTHVVVLAQDIGWNGMTRPSSTSGSRSGGGGSSSTPQNTHLSLSSHPQQQHQQKQFGRVLLTGKSGHSTTIKSPSSHKNKSVFIGESHLTGASTEVKRSADESQYQMEPPDPPISMASSSSRNTGPYFESNRTVVHMTARAGQTVLFDCTVVLLQGRTVS